ncbi:alginate export family protein [Sphingomonas sp. CJ20]
MYQPTPLTALGVSLLAAGAIPGCAFAQVRTGADATPLSGDGVTMASTNVLPAAQDANIIVVGFKPGQDQSAPQPPAQRAVPPSEKTPERAPANPAIRTYPRQADGHGVKLSGYNPSRWAEDWTVMRNPKKRDDFLDRLKYLPINAKGDIYVTLSGEARVRTTLTSNPSLTDSPYRREDMLRLVGGADVHVGPVRVYGEVVHGGLSGINYGTATGKARNDLMVSQAFAEVSGTVKGVGLGIRYGRQEFTDGPAALVSVKDNNTIRTVEQGVRVWGSLSKYRIDAFDFHHVGLGLDGISDDKIDKTTRFSGVTAGVVLADTKTRKLFLDPFAWRERNDKLKWGTTTGKEVRHYYGARLWGSLDKLTIDWTVSHQTGDFNGRKIDAWSAFVAQTYQISPKGLAPKLGIHFDYGSGGGTYGKGTVKAARTVTAGTIAYSYQGALSPTNLFQISPNVTVSPIKTLDITGEYQRSYRVTDTDAIYKGSGSAYAGSQLMHGGHIGDAARLQASWKITPRLSLTTRYEYFQPAGALEKSKAAKSHYLSSWVSFRF